MSIDNIIGWIKKLTEAGVAVIALAVVVQISSVSYTHLTLPTNREV